MFFAYVHYGVCIHIHICLFTYYMREWAKAHLGTGVCRELDILAYFEANILLRGAGELGSSY